MATVLTYTGEEWAASRLVGSGTLNIAATHIGWGSGTLTAAKGSASMGAEIGGASPSRTAATVTLSGTGSAAKLQAVGTLTAGSTLGITEAGLFSASTAAAPMFVWGDFSVINLAANDQITFTITIDPS